MKIQRLMLSVLVTGALMGSLASCSDENKSSAITIPTPDATTVEEILALDRPVILAHASGENIHPHSTPFGFADSVANGVDILDLDVQLSKDGILVVQHDDTVDRTTNKTGLVAGLTYQELNALDNAYWFTLNCTCKDQPEADYIYRGIRTGDKDAPERYTAEDFIIPKFEDIVAKYPNHMLNIEIKGKYPAAVPAAEELARILKDANALDRAVVTSFDDKLLAEFHNFAPSVEMTPGLSASSDWVLKRTPLPEGMRILQVPPDYEGIEVLTKQLVDDSHAAGYLLWIWPNERKWENSSGYSELLDMGVDGINAADTTTAVLTLKTWLKK